MGKNTLIRSALTKRMTKPVESDKDYAERIESWTPIPHWEPLLKLLKTNVGIIFTNGDLTDIKEDLDKNAREAPAKIGGFAQADVIIKAGPTGLDPKQTVVFQALSIATKIQKAQIEILSDTKIISVGEVVEASQAALLDKLNIRPFEYKLEATHVFDNGKIFPATVLNIKPENILAAYKKVLGSVTAISLAAGIPNRASAPHSITNAFKNLVAVTFETEYTFAQAEALKSAATAGPAATTEAKTDDKPVEAEEEKVVEDVDGPGDIFGGEDEY